MKTRALLLAGALSAVSVAKAQSQAFRVFSFRAPAVIQQGSTRSVAPSRGEEIHPQDTILVGSTGGITIETKGGSSVSVIGPALFSVIELRKNVSGIRIEYGDFLIRAQPDSNLGVDVRAGSGNLSWSEDGDGFSMYLEQPVSGDLLRVRNRGPDEPVLMGDRVSEGQTFYATGGRHWTSPTNQQDYLLVLNRHFNNRHIQDLASEGVKPYDPASVDPISGIVEMMPFVGFSRMRPSSATFDQNLGLIGLDLKVGLHTYIGIHPEPTRLDYLYSPAFRFGLGIGAQSGNVRFRADEGVTKPRMFYAYGFVGFGAHGASADLLVQFPYLYSLTGSYNFGFQSSYNLGMEFIYRIDLKILTNSESGLSLGARVMRYRLKFLNASKADDYSLTSNSFEYLSLIPVVAISMRF